MRLPADKAYAEAVIATINGDGRATTVNGEARITLRDTEPVGTQSREAKHVRTVDYDDRAIQVVVRAETVNGGVVVQGG